MENGEITHSQAARAVAETEAKVLRKKVSDFLSTRDINDISDTDRAGFAINPITKRVTDESLRRFLHNRGIPDDRTELLIMELVGLELVDRPRPIEPLFDGPRPADNDRVAIFKQLEDRWKNDQTRKLYSLIKFRKLIDLR